MGQLVRAGCKSRCFWRCLAAPCAHLGGSTPAPLSQLQLGIKVAPTFLLYKNGEQVRAKATAFYSPRSTGLRIAQRNELLVPMW